MDAGQSAVQKLSQLIGQTSLAGGENWLGGRAVTGHKLTTLLDWQCLIIDCDIKNITLT